MQDEQQNTSSHLKHHLHRNLIHGMFPPMTKASFSEPVGRKSITLPLSLWERINLLRHAKRIGSEAEAVRSLLQSALDAVDDAVKNLTGDNPSKKTDVTHVSVSLGVTVLQQEISRLRDLAARQDRAVGILGDEIGRERIKDAVHLRWKADHLEACCNMLEIKSVDNI